MIGWIISGAQWFDEMVISVVVEALFQSAGKATMVTHVTPQILHSARRILNNPNAEDLVKKEMTWIVKEVTEVRAILNILFVTSYSCFQGYNNDMPFLLMPAHVWAHWILAVDDQKARTIQFYNSIQDRIGTIHVEELNWCVRRSSWC